MAMSENTGKTGKTRDVMVVAIAEGKTEGRIAVISAILITTAIYISSFSPLVSILAILICIAKDAGCVRSIPLFAPFLGLFALSSCILAGPYRSAVVTLATLAMLVPGVMVSSLTPSEFALSLSWLGIPESWAFQVALALRVFRILMADAKRCLEAARFEGRFPYFKAMKAFASVAVLRSVALAETLYCRNYSGKIPGRLRRPVLADYLFLFSAISLLILSVFMKL